MAAVWFDLECMKGSVVDGMSEAVEGADVMISCISLAYKESASEFSVPGRAWSCTSLSRCMFADASRLCPTLRMLRLSQTAGWKHNVRPRSHAPRVALKISRGRCCIADGHQQNVEMLPLMMERGYKPTGWLGLLMGSRLYFEFHPAAVETDELFEKQMALVERDLGSRGKAKGRSVGRMSEGVPPRVAARSLEPSPALAPAHASTTSSAPDRSGFTTTMPMSSPVLTEQRSTNDASMVQVLLEQQRLMHDREDMMQAKMEAKMEQMEAKMETMRKEMVPAPAAEAISEEQIAALQARVEVVHAAKLLSSDELHSIEDTVADYLELKALMRDVVTLDMIHTNETASKLLKLVSLSEAVASDGMFARQARRKYM